jgi:hypothetical protein
MNKYDLQTHLGAAAIWFIGMGIGITILYIVHLVLGG